MSESAGTASLSHSFQLSLSTIFVLMAIASGLLFLQFQKDVISTDLNDEMFEVRTYYGFPAVVYKRVRIQVNCIDDSGPLYRLGSGGAGWVYEGFVANLVFGVSVLCTTAVLCNWWRRLRQRNSPTQAI